MDRRQREVVKMLRGLGIEFTLDTHVPKHPKLTLQYKGATKILPMAGSPTNIDHAINGLRRQVTKFMKDQE
jgi:hypothetical protein